MATIMTTRGHVARAKAFYDLDDIYFVLAHPFDWNIARLTSTNIGPFTSAINETLTFKINGVEYSYNILNSWVNKTTASVVSELNDILTTHATAVATDDNRVQVTAGSNDGDPMEIEVTSASTILGFDVGEHYTTTTGGTDVPEPLQTYVRPVHPFGYKKVTEKNMVIPDPDLPASVIGTVQGTTFNTSIGSGYNTMSFVVDGNVGSPISVTFLNSAISPISGSSNAVVEKINTAAAAVSIDYAGVASVDSSILPPRVKLTSPTKGSSSSIQILTGNAGLGFTAGISTGTDGGAIKYRLDQFSVVAADDIYTSGARMVHLLTEINYDEIPTNSYAQIGVVTGLTKKNSVPPNKPNLTHAEVLDVGVMEFLDHRQLTPRDADSREVLELIIEF